MGNLPDGLILSAGFSSRMSRFKPLCPIGSERLIERIVRQLREGGLKRIFAVTGFNAELLEKPLAEMGVTALFNGDFARGMYSSVRRGVSGLPADSPGFLMLPVDYPFILPETISGLVRTFRRSTADVVFPVCLGRKGHPPVIRSTLYGEILAHDGELGLGSLLNRCSYIHDYRETEDEGILYDTDTDEDLAEMMERFGYRIG